MKFLFRSRRGVLAEQIRLLALLGYRYNSFHQLMVAVTDYITGREETVTVISQFVAAQKRHPSSGLRVGRWSLNRAGLGKKMPGLREFSFIGLPETEKFDFYFPLDLSDEYEGLTAGLGEPDSICTGVLTPSGRSIWVEEPRREPFCLKIDTMQLRQKKFFSERALSEKGLIHSGAVSELLEGEKNVFREDRGASFTFSYPDPDGAPKKYTYLIRRLDSVTAGLRREDHLIPAVALLSEPFWQHSALLKSLGLRNRTAAEFLTADFARCFADMIRRSLDHTCVHFEVHQQNLTLQLRKGRGVQMLYHDLQDTVLDPVSFFLEKMKAASAGGLEGIYTRLYNGQKSVFLNSHGHLRRNDMTKENFSVVSLYRRYLRNFGHYTRTYNFFSGEDYTAARGFENAVLHHLAFRAEELGLDARIPVNEFLRKDLFWNIDRYHQHRQRTGLLELKRRFAGGEFPGRKVSSDRLMRALGRDIAICSNGFPVYLKEIDAGRFGEIYDLYHEKIFLAEYSGEPCLLMVFQYI